MTKREIVRISKVDVTTIIELTARLNSRAV